MYRSSGPGGQSVNTTDSAVRITHKPTGLVVTCQNEKSQLQNKEQAMRILKSSLLEREMRERAEQEGALRQAQVGTGDRSAKVRTYNFPQGRITDHRVGVTSHNLEATLGGDLEEFTQALAAKERADKLAAEAAGTPAKTVPDGTGEASAREVSRSAAVRLERAGVPETVASAEVLLSELLGIGRAELAPRQRS